MIQLRLVNRNSASHASMLHQKRVQFLQKKVSLSRKLLYFGREHYTKQQLEKMQNSENSKTTIKRYEEGPANEDKMSPCLGHAIEVQATANVFSERPALIVIHVDYISSNTN